MRRIVLAIAALLMLASCATYTVKDGYDSIVLPDESGTKLETRYRLIKEDIPEEIVFSEPEPVAEEEDIEESIPEPEAIEAPEAVEKAPSEAVIAAEPAEEEEIAPGPAEETVPTETMAEPIVEAL